MLRHRPPPETLAGAWPPQAPGAPPPLYHRRLCVTGDNQTTLPVISAEK